MLLVNKWSLLLNLDLFILFFFSTKLLLPAPHCSILYICLFSFLWLCSPSISFQILVVFSWIFCCASLLWDWFWRSALTDLGKELSSLERKLRSTDSINPKSCLWSLQSVSFPTLFLSWFEIDSKHLTNSKKTTTKKPYHYVNLHMNLLLFN